MSYFSNDKSASLPLISTAGDATAPQEQQERIQEESRTRVYVVDILLSCALPILLWTQFWLSVPPAGLPLNSAIGCFFLASLLYRKSLEDCNSESNSFATLLPELFTLATILLLCGNAPLPAFLCVSLGSAVMALAAIGSCIVSLLSDVSRASLLSFAMTVALPCLMYAEYYAVFLDSAASPELQGLQPPVAVIVFFFLASLLYRKVLNDHHSEPCYVLQLLPEIVAVSTIFLTSVGEIAAGFLCLVLGECLLVVVAVAFGALSIVARRNDVEDDESVSEEEPLYTAMTV